MTSNLPVLITPAKPNDTTPAKKVDEEKFDHAFMIALADIVIDSFLYQQKIKKVQQQTLKT